MTTTTRETKLSEIIERLAPIADEIEQDGLAAMWAKVFASPDSLCEAGVLADYIEEHGIVADWFEDLAPTSLASSLIERSLSSAKIQAVGQVLRNIATVASQTHAEFWADFQHFRDPIGACKTWAQRQLFPDTIGEKMLAAPIYRLIHGFYAK